MFIVELSYKVDITVVDKFLLEHRSWLDTMYEKGYFLCSGPKNPRDGGIIVALINFKAELEKLLSADPFYINQVADYRIIEFNPIKQHRDFTTLLKNTTTTAIS